MENKRGLEVVTSHSLCCKTSSEKFPITDVLPDHA